ncbi:hypothetical protein OS493_013143 [Desmophyllum pertusum]|uniref:Uncharacterized protein n=1 Tax=Desmophyllum pertusum TaxID=174260 RepID=A0A9W9YRG3_9CNID|nr:hypothetical protein OS493_013143 [Desmophyllum pertusum]
MFQAVIESIFEPGVNSQLLKATNITFVCLVVVIICMLIGFGFNIHLLVLLILSTGLLLSINWFVSELWRSSNEAKEEKKQE